MIGHERVIDCNFRLHQFKLQSKIKLLKKETKHWTTY